MRSYLIFASWSLLAGLGIPLIGILNSGVARSVGNPYAATAVMFGIASVFAFSITIPFYGVPNFAELRSAPAISYGAGLLIAFYVLSATVLIPKIGTASFIAYILIAQLLASAVVDHFGMLGVLRRPMDAAKFIGVFVILAGIAIMQFGHLVKKQG